MGGPTPPSIVSVNARISPALLVRGVKQTVHCYVSIDTGALPDAGARPPVHLAVVLDKSGSMSSQRKLETAKAAMANLVTSLSPGDRVSLVLYDTDVEVIARGQDVAVNRAKLLEQIKAIRSGSMTNLHGGLQRAIEVLTEAREEDAVAERPAAISRIFLFSDGLVNAGVTNKTAIHKLAAAAADKDLSIESFGLGTSFDEDLMQAIAEHGGGRYFFLEGAHATEAFVNHSLKGLLKMVGSGAVLQVRGGGHAAVVESASNCTDLARGVQLNTLVAENSRGVLVKMTVSPGGDADISAAEAGTAALRWTLRFQPPEGDAVEMTGDVPVGLTDSQADSDASRDETVETEVTVQEAASADAEVVQAMERGDISAAKQGKQRVVELLSTVSDKSSKAAGQLVSAQRGLKQLETEGITKNTTKHTKKAMYRARHNSAEYDAMDVAYEIQMS